MTTAEIVRPDCVGSSKATLGFGSSGTFTTSRQGFSRSAERTRFLGKIVRAAYGGEA
jgi:hypothetical protein